MFNVEKPKYEAPLAAAALGGLWGAGALGTAGILGGGLIGGLAGAGLGYVGGTLLESMQPKVQSLREPSPQQTAAATPAAPPPTAAPAVPQTPAATPVTPPVDTTTPVPTPFTPGEASTPTAQEVARGELERKRRGRLSTILTNRESTVGEEENERLGG